MIDCKVKSVVDGFHSLDMDGHDVEKTKKKGEIEEYLLISLSQSMQILLLFSRKRDIYIYIYKDAGDYNTKYTEDDKTSGRTFLMIQIIWWVVFSLRNQSHVGLACPLNGWSRVHIPSPAPKKRVLTEQGNQS